MWLDHGSAAYTTPVAAVALCVCVSGLALRHKMPSEQPSTFEFLGGLLGQHLVFLRIQKEWLEAGLHLGHLGSPKNLGFDLKKVMGCRTTESALVHPSTSRP